MRVCFPILLGNFRSEKRWQATLSSLMLFGKEEMCLTHFIFDFFQYRPLGEVFS